MSTFKDGDGREWELRLHLGNLARVKAKTGVNINDALKTVTSADGVRQTTALMTQLVEDPYLLYSVVVILLERQFKEQGVTEEQFAESLNDEDVANGLIEALHYAVIDYFPPHQRRALKMAFERLWKAGRKKAEEQVRKGIEKIERIDFEALVESAFSSSPGSSEASSGSIQDHSASESSS